MKKRKLISLISSIMALLACTISKPIKPTKKCTGYLNKISQTELAKSDYKRYFYSCKNFETGGISALSTYFPLSRERRLQHNFSIYFQLNSGKIEPFDHMANVSLNSGSRFEVIYRSYYPIQGHYISLVTRQNIAQLIIKM